MGKMKQETAIDYEKLANHWNNNDENSEALNALQTLTFINMRKRVKRFWQ